MKICIVRLSAVGDVCNVVPTVRALQRQWPGAEIAWVIGRREHTLVRQLDGVRFLPFDKGRPLLAELWRLRLQLRGERFDALLQMQAALRASLVATQIRAARRIGLDAARSKDLQRLFVRETIAPRPRAHMVETFLDFAARLERPVERFAEPEWRLPVEVDAAALRAAFPRLPGAYLVISPCASRAVRNWHASGYAAVAEHAWERHRLHAVLTGGTSAIERSLGEQIIAQCRHAPINCIGATTLPQLAAILRGARLLIAPDSGPVHIANAVGTPTLGLYANTNPERAGPYRERRWTVNRYPQALQRRFGKGAAELPWGQRVRDANAMGLITMEAVCEKLDAWAEWKTQRRATAE